MMNPVVKPEKSANVDRENATGVVQLASGFIDNVSQVLIPPFSGACYQGTFHVGRYTDALASTLLGAELNRELARSVIKRRAEFIAGRCLAVQALRRLGAEDVVVTVGQHRAPVWPTGFVGAISHCATLAICAVAYSHDVQKLGVDIEAYIVDEMEHSVFTSVVTEAEHELFDRYPGYRHALLTVIFSAKESLFKALFPLVGYYFGFEAARLKEINFSAGTLVMELITDLIPELPAGYCFDGIFRLHDRHVFTMIMECAGGHLTRKRVVKNMG